MTALSIAGARTAPFPFRDRFTGLRSLVRKDVTEWLRGRRAWVVLIVVTAFMVLTAANSWIVWTANGGGFPDGVVDQFTLDPVDNLLRAVGAQVWIVATVFAIASLVAGERSSGTLSWVASKPVGREAIWMSKLVSAGGMLGIVAATLPLAITTGLVTVLYGAPQAALIAGLAVGMLATVVFFAAVGLALGTVIPGQPAVAGATFGVFALPMLLGAVLPFDVSPYLPTSILGWAAGLATGAPVSVVTPIAWIVATVVVVGFALRRMTRMEL
jgi:ABC-2 type transport system permease protein